MDAWPADLRSPPRSTKYDPTVEDIKDVREIQAGDARYRFPSPELAPLVDSSDVLDDRDALVARLDADGYLYLPGLLERDAVLNARHDILALIGAEDGLAPGTPPDDAVINPAAPPVRLLGRREITHLPSVLGVLEHPRLVEVVTTIHDEPTVGFDFKWLRAVGTGDFTGVHVDRVYMGRGSDRLMTAWVPFGDVPLEMGSLCVCPGSHRNRRFQRLHDTYGHMDVDRDLIEGWFSTDPAEITRDYEAGWHTGDVSAGDVVMFGMDLLHASTTNQTDRWRISCDVRFQPAADRVDERWVGGDPVGHDPASIDPAVITPMVEARARWGL